MNKTAHPLYSTYRAMKSRCYNPKATRYNLYGKKGVTVCKRWLDDFWNFVDDMGDRPPDCTLDRIDNDGPYSPDNCRWATNRKQNQNRKDNKLLTYQGETMTMTQWSRKMGYSDSVIGHRIARGWPTKKAIFTPPRNRRSLKNGYYHYKGELLTSHQIEAMTGIKAGTFRNRISYGWSVEEAAETPVDRNETATKYEYDGKRLTLRDWAQETGFSYTTLYRRIHTLKWSLARALTQPIQEHKNKHRREVARRQGGS